MSTRQRKAEDASSDLPGKKRIRTMPTPPAVRMYQPDENAGARLLHSHGPLLHILEYTMMKEKYETDLWKWLAQIRRVCQAFRDLTPHLVPVKFSLTKREMQTRGALVLSLMRSFPAAPWKTAKIAKISNCSLFFPLKRDRSFCESLRSLLETPGSLPNLEELHLRATESEPGDVLADFLYAVARNLPRLSHLHLKGFGGRSRLGETVTPEQFGTFAQLLQRPLQALTLDGCGIRNTHLNAFFSNHGSSLTELMVGYDNVSDLGIHAISQQCSNLVRLSLPFCSITSSGLEAILRANRGICHLDLSFCNMLSSDSINVLVQHAPHLESLDLSGPWFTDECLERLVQGQIDHWKRAGEQEIPLCRVDAWSTAVSRAGIDRVRSKPRVSAQFLVQISN